jgi:hypothetical protein
MKRNVKAMEVRLIYIVSVESLLRTSEHNRS